jgi:hypothetical protein
MNCYCHFCGQPVPFHIGRAGETVNCFNCGMETVLFIPGLPTPYAEDQHLLETRETKWAMTQFGIRCLEGIVENKSSKHLDWVRIEFILFGQAGVPIGSTSDCLINVAPNKVWKFRAPVAQADVTHASEPLVSCEYGRVAQPKTASVVNRVARPQ